MGVFAHNSIDTDQTSRYQPGSTGVVALDDECTHVVEKGHDHSQMGRWSWLKFRGKQSYTLRVLSVYRPVKSLGLSSTFQQQVRGLHKISICGNPRQVLLDDLQTLLQQWVEAGDNIVVAMYSFRFRTIKTMYVETVPQTIFKIQTTQVQTTTNSTRINPS